MHVRKNTYLQQLYVSELFFITTLLQFQLASPHHFFALTFFIVAYFSNNFIRVAVFYLLFERIGERQ